MFSSLVEMSQQNSSNERVRQLASQRNARRNARYVKIFIVIFKKTI